MDTVTVEYSEMLGERTGVVKKNHKGGIDQKRTGYVLALTQNCSLTDRGDRRGAKFSQQQLQKTQVLFSIAQYGVQQECLLASGGFYLVWAGIYDSMHVDVCVD
ncbi:hypothetical protein AMECASPLE_038079 [Ameca splendens]|uniref:Uncharacterized protein n=1 Tax=Ameca splendens TaxID=208324 RepID=A0ABV0Y7Z9_9TELE